MDKIEISYSFTNHDISMLVFYTYTRRLLLILGLMILCMIFILFISKPVIILNEFLFDWILPFTIMALLWGIILTFQKRKIKGDRLFLEPKIALFSANGIEITGENSTVRYLWSEICKLNEDKYFYYFCLKNKQKIPIPKRSFDRYNAISIYSNYKNLKA